ncbi:transglutaminase-like domain-containing protein [Pelagibaculum spongiae]|uniref:Transglutaminase-like domain-containing protein n=1 Tax=Pelagibaculum spongiae TaxID=2080658 RepID=A0A2V1GXC0_9GAMM|nr:transglutaminase-like domain-containing protein [Pelagibaculum spongiae]PVZ71744.1 hypothetical protein DC094_01580 [Pelagibaculum spongiae]
MSHETLARKVVLEFSKTTMADFQPIYSSYDEPYLREMRSRFQLLEKTAKVQDSYSKVRILTQWVHGLWQHDGVNQPESSDPISIIEQALQGQRFRCVEYSIVLNAVLNAVGLVSRILWLARADVETRESGAAHAVTEFFSPDLNKWIMVDPQMGVMVCKDNMPLSAIELQAEIVLNSKLEQSDETSELPMSYFEWIYPYLFYFVISYDARINPEKPQSGQLMLVPIGENQPKVFQKKLPIKVNCTHLLADFYQKPA